MHIGRFITQQIQFTRPNNATQYSVDDAISDDATTATIATFTLPAMASVEGLGGIIHSVTLYKSDQDLTGADFDILLFQTAPAGTTFEDNAAQAITDAVMQTCVGFISLTASADAHAQVAGDMFCKTNLDLAYSCAAGSRALYVVLIAKGTYTPAAQEVFTVRFGVEYQ